jgi:lipoprotein-anchoring transpeptidase ErfK/SrfK
MSSKLRCVAGTGSSQPSSGTRQPLMRGLAVALLAGVVPFGLTGRAEAQFYQYPSYQYPPGYGARPDVNPAPAPNPAPKPKPKPAADHPPAKAEPAKDFGPMPKGPLQIVVSIASQHVTLYSNGVHVAQGPVSTGIPGKPTPMGVFSIIEKDRFHHSNLYSNAPMPFMERITWSGVALHEGPLPGYPASHGCIRMTQDFAARLWRVTQLGVRVIVARNDVVPTEFSHPRLFAPKPKPTEPPEASKEPLQRSGSLDPVKVAEVTATIASKPADPASAVAAPAELRGALESSGQIVAVAAAADEPSSDAEEKPAEPAAAAAAPAATPIKSDIVDPPKPAPAASDPPKSAPPPPAPKNRASAQPAKRTGEVAVFISRKEKKLYVRQGFAPLFDVPVTIERPDQPLGIHVFTAMGLTANGAGMRWNVMSLPAEPAHPVIAPKIGAKSAPPPKSVELLPASTAAQALDRIQIPQEAIDRISEIMVPGTSVVIADDGLGRETGTGTDFIVLTH